MIRHSSSSSAPGFRRIASGTPILPMSCSSAPRRTCTKSSSPRPRPSRQLQGHLRNPPAVPLGFFVPQVQKMRPGFNGGVIGDVHLGEAELHLIVQPPDLLLRRLALRDFRGDSQHLMTGSVRRDQGTLHGLEPSPRSGRVRDDLFWEYADRSGFGSHDCRFYGSSGSPRRRRRSPRPPNAR